MGEKIRTYLIWAVSICIFVSTVFFGLVLFKVIDIPSFLSPKPSGINKVEQEIAISPKPSTTQGPRLSSDILQRVSQVSTNSAVVLSIKHVIYEGEIIEMDLTGGQEKRINLEYSLMLKIKGKGSIINQIYFSQPDMAQIKIVQEAAGQETPLNISSFKVGDSVILNLTIDQLKSTYNNILSGKLTKL